MTTKTLAEIEQLTLVLSREREKLDGKREAFEASKRQLATEFRRSLLTGIERVKAAESILQTAIDENRWLFTKPRSRTFHAIRVGLLKSKGELTWGDPAQVVRLIRRKLPDQAAVLIRVTESPAKAALATLSASDLQRIGVQVVETDDKILIKGVATELDKWMAGVGKDFDDVQDDAA